MTDNPIPERQYIFDAVLTHIVDGDTIDVDIDMGLHCHRIERLRILRINAPEMRGPSRPEGIAAKDFITAWLGNESLVVQTYKSDVFGRYLAEVWRKSDGANLSDAMLESGHAVEEYK